MPVLFDTGSSGLRILARDVGPNVRHTKQAVSHTYADGTILDGHVAYADVSFPTASLPIRTGSIAIEVVEDARCSADRPKCPGITGISGVLGTNYIARNGIFNPLAQLPPPFHSGFIVDMREGRHPHVRVGIGPGDLGAFRFTEVRTPPAAGSGFREWHTDRETACFNVDDATAGCERVLFDTGGAAMGFSPGRAGKNTRNDESLERGHRVSMRVGSVVDYIQTSGPGSPVRLRTRSHASSGEAFFRQFAVLYDAIWGRIGFLR